MRFRAPDGNVFTGNTYEEVVAAMASEKLEEPETLARYRVATADRVADLTGNEVDPTTDESFVSSLVDSQMLEEL